MNVDSWTVQFDVGTGKCAGRLFRPRDDGGEKRPAVVLAHGFALTQDALLPAVAKVMAERGLVALTFDYRGFGASDKLPGQMFSVRGQREDIRAALAYARTLSFVDAQRVALWGYSYGGGHVIHVAAQDRAVAAVVTRAPFVNGWAYIRTRPLAEILRLVAAGLGDQLAGLTGRQPRYMPLIGPAGTAVPYAEPGFGTAYRRVVEHAPSWKNQIAPRALLYVAAYRPIRKARKLDCPVFISGARDDRIAPPPTATDLARRVPAAELRGYPGDHFSINEGDAGARVTSEETDWMAGVLASAKDRTEPRRQ